MSGFSSYSNDYHSGSGDSNSIHFVVKQLTRKMHTALPVQIIAVYPGDITGFVDVKPMVDQINGNGDPTPHGTIYRIPYFRSQGGSNAIILDPAVGDIGLHVVASRDVSNVKEQRKATTPGSRRSHNLADGFYFGGFRNSLASQYIKFGTDGITIVSPTAVTLQAPKVTITTPELKIDSANVKINGASLTHNDINIGSTHRHPDAQGGVTGPPQ